MKIVIAVSDRDKHLAEAQAELIAKQGGVGAHSCLLVVAPNMQHRIGAIASNLQRAFPSVDILQLTSGVNEPSDKSSPFSHVIPANQMFQAAINYLIERGNRNPIYWFEPDCVPVAEVWADELARDWLHTHAMGKQFLGHFCKKILIERVNGEISLKEIDENYMMGSGIYPHDLPRYSTLWKAAKTTPFDVMMQWETSRRGEHTDKILHNHATNNYKVVQPMTDDQPAILSCDVIHSWGRSKKEITVTKDTKVIHGCKDTSLAEIIKNGGLTKQPRVKSNPKIKSDLQIE